MCSNCGLVDGEDRSSEARYTPPRADCPHPEDWHACDSDSTEAEVVDMIGAIVKGLRPRGLVIETGAAFGYTSKAIGEALYGTEGHLISFEIDGDRVSQACQRTQFLPVEIRREDSLNGLRQLAKNYPGQAQVIFLDSLFELRPQEFELAVPLLAPGGWILVHDCGDPSGSKYPKFSRQMYDIARREGFVGISALTPRGFTIFAREVH